MQENIITWNVANWITVVLMVTLGFALLSVGMKYAHGKASKNDQG